MVTEPGTAIRDRRLLAQLVLFAVILVAGLLIAKWLPYGQRALGLSVTHQWSGAALPATGETPSLTEGWTFLISYGKAVWLALVVAVLTGAAIEALLPRSWLAASVGRGPWAGALFAVPSMMCTCCTAPIVTSLRRTGVNVGPAVAYWLGNPVLNPAVLVFLAFIGPWQWTLTRLLAGIALVLGAARTVARIVPEDAAPSMGAPITEQKTTVARLLRALAWFTLVLVPEYALITFAVGVFRPWLFPPSATGSVPVVVGVVIATLLGLLMVIPTAGEIPILLGLAAAGVSPMIIGVLLITLPAISLPSMILVARAVTWRATAVIAGFVAASGLAAGLLLELLSR